VQDEAGRALSNSPDVTLSIVSGPGKFPTGRSISFSNKSLVAIRDGQAAISFRSYDAGQTVIEATSPGLKPARLTITTTGPDKFRPGKTPLAADLPVISYPPFTRIAFPGDPVNVTINRPTAPSSAQAGHEGPKANDDELQTWWQADARDAAPFWLVHLENVYALHWLSLVMLDENTPDFVVEISKDSTRWEQVGDAKGGRKSYDFALYDRPLTATFLRIRFLGAAPDRPAALREVRVIAKPAS